MIKFIILRELPGFISGSFLFSIIDQSFVPTNIILNLSCILALTFVVYFIIGFLCNQLAYTLGIEDYIEDEEYVKEKEEVEPKSNIIRIGMFQVLKNIKIPATNAKNQKTFVEFVQATVLQIVEFQIKDGPLMQTIHFVDDSTGSFECLNVEVVQIQNLIEMNQIKPLCVIG